MIVHTRSLFPRAIIGIKLTQVMLDLSVESSLHAMRFKMI